jgi:hypothetical protein
MNRTTFYLVIITGELIIENLDAKRETIDKV